ncbi:hypothetical protein [Photobacterium kishitanii]|uniref:hypothetical protein n=1 Tax=Photobacterium kishitanii TaxID=318456 RepID=UPI00071AED81|nr:hypothetical protein [Photobacterium kishitanii]
MKKLILLTTASVFLCLSGCSVNNSIYDHLKMMGYSDLSRTQLLSHIDNTYIKSYVDGIYKNKNDIINKNINSIVRNKSCILEKYNSKLSKQDLVITSLIYAENPNSIPIATMFAIDHYGSNIVDTVINKVNFINHSCLTSA